jgi:tetratricopeptide (TPR) repeat protein
MIAFLLPFDKLAIKSQIKYVVFEIFVDTHMNQDDFSDESATGENLLITPVDIWYSNIEEMIDEKKFGLAELNIDYVQGKFGYNIPLLYLLVDIKEIYCDTESVLKIHLIIEDEITQNIDDLVYAGQKFGNLLDIAKTCLILEGCNQDGNLEMQDTALRYFSLAIIENRMEITYDMAIAHYERGNIYARRELKEKALYEYEEAMAIIQLIQNEEDFEDDFEIELSIKETLKLKP